MERTEMKRGLPLLILATILWGGNYVCGRFLAPALPATLLNTIRWAISTLLLWGLLALNKKSFPIFQKWRIFLVLGFFGVFAFSTLNYAGLRSLSASYAGMISAGIPIAILVFTPIILKEKIQLRAWLGALVSLIGVILLMAGKHGVQNQASLFGEAAIVLSCLSWGIYTVLGKKYGKQTDPLTLTAGAAFYGTLLSALSCIGTVHSSQIHITPMALLSILYVSTLASVGAYVAWNTGVRLVGPGTAAPFINLLPVWTVIFGLLLLHEQLSNLTFIGGLVTIIGAVFASLKTSKRKAKLQTE